LTLPSTPEFYLELEIKEKKRIINFWNEKKLSAEYRIKENEQKMSRLRARFSIIKMKQYESDENKPNYYNYKNACVGCGLPCVNTDFCEWCYEISEGVKND
jgi:hypothetical protein